MTASPFCGRRVLVTGHTGFKGAWLTHWLARGGAKVFGFSLPPEGERSLFADLALSDRCESTFGDVRDSDAVTEFVRRTDPEMVFHLAAQPLVRRSYRTPVETFSTNVMGTLHVLDACRYSSAVRGIVVVTSDKCYRPAETPSGYREGDALGGDDPYSASKACTEIAAHSWRSSFLGAGSPLLLSTVRAGNVVGGGDWAEDRLVPDLVRAFMRSDEALIRNPNALRPWQHVLEPLGAYLLIGQRLLNGDRSAARAWNFGPAAAETRSVGEVCSALSATLPVRWRVDGDRHPHEAAVLRLDSSDAQRRLSWSPRWDFETTFARTGEWYRKRLSGAEAIALCDEQLELFESAAPQCPEPLVQPG